MMNNYKKFICFLYVTFMICLISGIMFLLRPYYLDHIFLGFILGWFVVDKLWYFMKDKLM